MAYSPAFSPAYSLGGDLAPATDAPTDAPLTRWAPLEGLTVEGHNVREVLAQIDALATLLTTLGTRLQTAESLTEVDATTIVGLQTPLLCAYATLSQLCLSARHHLEGVDERASLTPGEQQTYRHLNACLVARAMVLQRSVESVVGRLVALTTPNGGYITFALAQSSVFLLSAPTVSTPIDVPTFVFCRTARRPIAVSKTWRGLTSTLQRLNRKRLN